MRRMEQTPSTIEQKPEDTVTLKRSHFYAVLVVFAFTVGLLFGYALWGRTARSPLVVQVPPTAQVVAAATVTQGGEEAQTADPASEEAAQANYTRYDIPTEGYPSLGPSDAEIVIVEFSDYQ